MNALVADVEVTPTKPSTALRTKFKPPFIYWEYGKSIGYLRLGFKIRGYYRKYLDTDDFQHLEDAVPDISLFVGVQWQKIFHTAEHDRDVMDPAAYLVIFALRDKKFPRDNAFPNYCRTTVARELLKNYKIYQNFGEGDPSIRKFNYKPFPTAYDVEHKIFIDDLQDCVLDFVEHDTRLDDNERPLCRYLAICSLRDDKISNTILKIKFGFNPSKDRERLRFLVDFTDVIVRNYLYRVKDDIPNLYETEKPQFVSIFHQEEEELVDLKDEETFQSYHTQMGYLR